MRFQPRSLLYVPVTAHRFLGRAGQRGADAIVLDLEDSIAAADKASAREGLSSAFAAVREGAAASGNAQIPLLVRVNSDDDLVDADVRAALLAGCDGLVIPKVEAAMHVQRVAAQVDAFRAAHAGRPSIALQAIVETPAALFRLEEIAHASPQLASLAFGSEDFATALDTQPTPEAMRLPAQWVAIASAAAGLHPMGLAGSIGAYADLEAFGRLAVLSRELGLQGAACIHPAQLALIHAAFGIHEAELQEARALIAAYEAALAGGQGALAFGGRMVDAPIADRARALLSRAGASR